MASNGKPNLFNYHTFCLVTGGSKGLGKCISTRFASLLPKNSVMLLMARSSDQLLKTKALIEESTPGIKVKVIPIDLTNASNDDFEDCLNATFTEFKTKPCYVSTGYHCTQCCFHGRCFEACQRDK